MRSGSPARSNSPAPPKAVQRVARTYLRSAKKEAPAASIPRHQGLPSRDIPSREDALVDTRSQITSVPSVREGACTFSTPLFDHRNLAAEVQSPLRLVQLGINPREMWIGKFLERTRTEEAKANFRGVLSESQVGML